MKTVTIFSEDKLISLGATKKEAQNITAILKKEQHNPGQCWSLLTQNILHPSMPDTLHHELFKAVYNQDDKYSDAPPAWFPGTGKSNKRNLDELLDKWGLDSFEELHAFSVTHKSSFWQHMIDRMNIPFRHEAGEVMDLQDGLMQPRWLAGASFNIAEACFRAAPDKTALVYGNESGNIVSMTYQDLEELSKRVANGLSALGFKKGDRAAIDMPMTAEAVAIYLGIVMAGGVVVSIADSLAPAEVEKRLRIAGTRLLFTQDVLWRKNKELPLYEKLLETDPVQTVVLPAREKIAAPLRRGDLSWTDFLPESTAFTPVGCTAGEYCNILFSSGTTGAPKAIPWTHATPIKAAADGFAHQDIQPDDVVAWPTNLGWMMGPWLIFATLINQATMGLFYGAPAGKNFGRFVQDAGVTILGVIPSMVKHWKQTGSLQGLNWTKIKLFSSTGESSNPQDYLWLMAQAGYKPVIEYCGGTEIGGGYMTGTLLQPASPAAFTTPALGLDIIILDDQQQPASEGEVFLIPPSIGLSNELINKKHHKVYYDTAPAAGLDWISASGTPLRQQTGNTGLKPLLRKHGDEFIKLGNGYFRARGRADDTMNLGGIKTSSVEIEQLLDALPGVHETAAIAAEPLHGGPNQLVIYCTRRQGGEETKEMLKELFQDKVKKALNPLFKISDVVIVDQLPRTASNKIMRRVLRNEYEKK